MPFKWTCGSSYLVLTSSNHKVPGHHGQCFEELFGRCVSWPLTFLSQNMSGNLIVWKPILHTVYYSMGIVACTHPLVQSSLRYSSLVANKCYLPAIVLVILCNKLNSTRAQLTVQYSNHGFDICIMCECRSMSFYRV